MQVLYLIKKTLKYIGFTLLGFILCVALYLFCAFVLSRFSVDGEPAAAHSVAVYILTNGVHTDVVVPVKNSLKDWGKEVELARIANINNVVGYLAFGWGDKGFYVNTPTWAQLKFSVAFKAIFGLGTSAIQTTLYKN